MSFASEDHECRIVLNVAQPCGQYMGTLTRMCVDPRVRTSGEGPSIRTSPMRTDSTLLMQPGTYGASIVLLSFANSGGCCSN
jgi:hypothetical protein